MESSPIEKITDSENKNLRLIESLESFKINLNSKESKNPTEIEKKHVYEVYDKIAIQFTR